MDELKEIELRTGDDNRRRININARAAVLNVPVAESGCLGSISYMASGQHTEDGIEIWTPQKPEIR